MYNIWAWVQKTTIGAFWRENFWQVNNPQKLLTNPSARIQKLYKTYSEVQMVGFVVLFFVIKQKYFVKMMGKLTFPTKATILTNNLKNQRSLPLL